MMGIHELKCWPEFFEEILAGRKRHDLRRCDDRRFTVGDVLRLQEFDPHSQSYTGRDCWVKVLYITNSENVCALFNDAMGKNYCIMSIGELNFDAVAE